MEKEEIVMDFNQKEEKKILNNSCRSKVKILFIEDTIADVDLALIVLIKENLEFEHSIVCTKTDLLIALEEFRPDLIISDYMMPSFNGLHALNISKEFDPSIPFILCTGSVNEEVAVDCMKAGAVDYIIKEHMTRLPFAVREALEQARINKEKRASELLLKENEEKLQSIFNASQIGIGLLVGRKLIEVDDFLCKLVGYERKELIGKSTEILFSTNAEFINSGKDQLRQLAEKGIGTVETKFRCKNGLLIDVMLSTAPLDKTDYSRGITFTVLDITERKKSEETLKESERRFTSILSNIELISMILDREGTLTFCNDYFLNLTGWKREEIMGSDWFIQFIPPENPEIRDVFGALLQNSPSSWHHENEILTRTGERRLIRFNNSTLHSLTGEIIGTASIGEDITDQKTAELILRESEEKYRRIFENVQDVYYETSIEGNIIEVSPSIANLSGHRYKPEDLIGRSMYEFYSDPKERNLFTSELQEKGYVTDFEISLIDNDGLSIPCSLSSTLVRDVNGNPEKIIGSLRNISDRKNASDALRIAKEKAEMSDRLKTEFLNNISHEVRTPLNGILGFAEILTLHNLTEDEKKESLSMLQESSNRLLNTINNYMDISLVASGNLTVNMKIFNPAAMLKKIYDNFNLICFNRKVGLFLDIPGESDEYLINSDPDICRKIITHFLDNSVKFTENGSIQFGFTEKDGNLVFFVKDTGRGINQDSFKIIFDRFEKASVANYRISEGSGLGLSIAKGMSDAINANISLESEPGKGSTFFLSVPMVTVRATDMPVNPGHEKKIIKGSPILVAEDDAINYYYLSTLLVRETDSKIFHAHDGREAIEIFKANPDIKLILMDMKMPEVDGFEATRQIKLINSSVHIIAVTAYAMAGDEEKVMAAGCDGYLSKPINQKSLYNKIAEFIKI